MINFKTGLNSSGECLIHPSVLDRTILAILSEQHWPCIAIFSKRYHLLDQEGQIPDSTSQVSTPLLVRANGRDLGDKHRHFAVLEVGCVPGGQKLGGGVHKVVAAREDIDVVCDTILGTTAQIG
jgi:hypothetical protein